MKNTKPKFIDFEGIGRSGKTTQVKFASKLLEKNNIAHIVTREPGGIDSAEKIRELIFRFKGEELIGSEGQMSLFFAARKLWMDEIVVSNLERGVSVITDRSYPSTAAYQGFGGVGT